MSETEAEQAQRWMSIWARGMSFYAEACAQEVLANEIDGARKYAKHWSRARERYMSAWTRHLVAEGFARASVIDWYGDDEGAAG